MKKLLLSLLCLIFSVQAFSEGSRQLDPQDMGVAKLYIRFGDPVYDFATEGASERKRIYIRVANPGELIAWGFNVESGDAEGTGVKLISPSGEVFLFSLPLSGENGYINSIEDLREDTIKYGANFIEAAEIGDWQMEFIEGGSGEVVFKYFDINVVIPGRTAGELVPVVGRVFAYSWQLKLHPDHSYQPFTSSLYTIDNFGNSNIIGVGQLYSPNPVIIEANSSGTSNDPVRSLYSIPGRIEGAEFPLFLQEPDYTVFQLGNIPTTSVSNLNIVSCGSDRHNINFHSSHAGYAELLLKPDPTDPGKNVQIRTHVLAGANTVIWNGMDGLNNVVQNGTVMTVELALYMLPVNFLVYNGLENHVTPFASYAPDPMSGYPVFFDDRELSGNISPFGGCSDQTCGRWQTIQGSTMNRRFFNSRDAVTQNFTLSIPTIDAGLDRAVCGALEGQPFTLYGNNPHNLSIAWRTPGSGYFSDSTLSSSSYYPSAQDIVAGSIQLTFAGKQAGCPDLIDHVVLTFTTVNAGADIDVCSGDTVQLNGSHINGGTPYWRSENGGEFIPNEQTLNAKYVPSASELSSGKSRLILFVSSCITSDTVDIYYKPKPVTNFDLAPEYCSNDLPAPLNPNPAGGIFTGTGTTADFRFDPAAAGPGAFTIEYTYTDPNTGCSGSNSKNTVINAAPVVSFSMPAEVCRSSEPIALSGTPAGGVFSGSGVTQAGIFDPSLTNSSSVIITYTYTDVTTGCSGSHSNTVNIIQAPTVTAGADQNVCEVVSSVQLSGSVQGSSSVIWSTTTGGVFSASGSLNTAYTPSQQDRESGFMELTLTAEGGVCPDASDIVKVVFDPIPTVDAGPDDTVCVTQTSYQLNGSYTNATGVNWYTNTGGQFSPDAFSPSPVYTFSTTDVANGQVTIRITPTGTSCTGVYQDKKIRIAPVPVANAGTDLTVCANTPVKVSGTAQNAVSVQWTGGVGIYSAGAETLNATYEPTVDEIAEGGVILTLTAFGDPACQSSSDDVQVTLTPAPTANAGPDQEVCSNVESVAISGAVTVATGGSWTRTGTGFFNPDANTLTGSYIPSAADRSAGQVTLTLTTTGNGLCYAESDEMTIIFTPAPTANAGADKLACVSATSVDIAGTVSEAAGFSWNTLGTGTFNPDPTTLIGAYIPSENDKSAQTVTLKLTAEGNGICGDVVDEMLVTFSPLPTADAGTDQIVCANKEVVLNGTVTGATGGRWSGGAGKFIPDANTLNASYYPTSTEKANGSVLLVLTSTGNGACDPVSDQVSITLTPAPLVDAGPNQSMTSSAQVQLDGRVLNATGGTWSTSGNGTLTSATDLQAKYTPSAEDLNLKKVVLTLTTTGNGACNAAIDQMVLTSNEVVCNVDMNIYTNQNNITFEAFNTDGVSVGSYMWNFGDGHSGSGKIQSNVYNQAGTYYVSVFYTTPDSSCTSIEYDTVQISQAAIPTYTISGIVKAEGVTIDHSVLTLFKFDGRNYDYLRALEIDETSNGAYSFSGLENGYYLVHALPSPTSVQFDTYVATYYGNDTIWEDAAFIQINNANFTTANIDLVYDPASTDPWNSGVDDVFGVITFASGVNLKLSSGSENPVENAVVTLYNSSGDRLTSTYTDPFGNYSFENLEPGDYLIGVEYAGTDMSDSVSITTDGSGSQTEANTSVAKEEITLGIFKGIAGEGLNLYPNPATNLVSVNLPEGKASGYSMNVYNSAGVLVKEGRLKASSGTVEIDVEELEEGFYILELKSGDKQWRERFLKQ